MTDYAKYVNSSTKHYISNCGHDENNKYRGGEAGDQTGTEYYLRTWYNRPWTCVLRYPDAAVRDRIAILAIDAALNNKIGYDQSQRTTFWTQLKAANYDPAAITVKCEADCTSSTAAIVKAVGFIMDIPALQRVSINTSSRNMRVNFKNAGFVVLTDKKYLTSGNYLLPGDILLYEDHHAAINVTKGSKAESEGDLTTVAVTGRNVYVRVGPSVDYAPIGVAHMGEKYSYLNEQSNIGNGWYKIMFKTHEGWISCKYSKLI